MVERVTREGGIWKALEGTGKGKPSGTGGLQMAIFAQMAQAIGAISPADLNKVSSGFQWAITAQRGGDADNSVTWFVGIRPTDTAPLRARGPVTMYPMLLLVLGSLFSLLSVQACPQAVLTSCQCQDLHNGVQLDCSNSDGSKTVQLLRDNQALLGLIQGLTMHNANLRRLPAKFLDGLYIKRLDLSYNEMVEIDVKAFSGMSAIVQELILTHNNLTKVPSEAIASLTTVLRLDLSNNSIADITHNDAFPSLPKLYDINLGSNNICAIHSATFENVKNSIQIINLGHNCMHSVPSSAIRGLKQLQALHMQKNNIDALEALNFLNLPVLNLLNLAGNKISEMNRQAFLNVPQLKYLYLTNNHISRLSAHQFASFDQIEMIDLTGNEITDIPSECMAQLPQLRQLFLGGNRIRSIGKDAFANSSIIIMSLINNELTEITDGMLDGLPNLQSIAFKSNKIKTIHQNAFYNTPSLVMIDLSENEIVDLSPSLFLAQLNLQMVDLRHNKIIRTPYAALNHRIGTVFLQENPLVCTEKIHMLQDGQGVYITTSEDIVCGGKPSTTTTTSAPVMMPKMTPKRQNSSDQVPSGAFSQLGLINEVQEAPQGEQGKGIAIHRISEEKDHTGPYPHREIVRSRGPHQLEISSSHITGQTDENFIAQLENNPIQPLQTTEPIKPKNTTENADAKEINSAAKPARAEPMDLRDNPNVILPFPVPFLKRPPTQRESTRVKSASVELPSTSVQDQPTLPPSVVILSKTRTSSTEKQKTTPDEYGRLQQFALRSNSSDQSQKNAIGTQPHVPNDRVASPTFIIVLCMTVVAVVMVSVVIGLCIMRHRHIAQFPSSSTYSSSAHTNAYISAQAAQMNAIYGTMERNRGTNSFSRSDDVQPWLHNPGHNYCNYYK